MSKLFLHNAGVMKQRRRLVTAERLFLTPRTREEKNFMFFARAAICRASGLKANSSLHVRKIFGDGRHNYTHVCHQSEGLIVPLIARHYSMTRKVTQQRILRFASNLSKMEVAMADSCSKKQLSVAHFHFLSSRAANSACFMRASSRFCKIWLCRLYGVDSMFSPHSKPPGAWRMFFLAFFPTRQWSPCGVKLSRAQRRKMKEKKFKWRLRRVSFMEDFFSSFIYLFRCGSLNFNEFSSRRDFREMNLGDDKSFGC